MTAVRTSMVWPARIPVVLAVAVSGVVLSGGVAEAATVSVPGDFATIQAALNAAAPGDTVRVAPGQYPEQLNFQGKDVRLESSEGPAATELAVPGGQGVQIGPAGAFVGFTVTGAIADFGAGIQVSGEGTLIQGNVFDGNAQTAGGFGAAIGGNIASPRIDRNVFRNNSCDDQFLSGVVSFVNDSSPRITNNLFHDNPCRAVNLTLPESTAPRVVNNTMVGNAAGIYVDGRVPSAAQVLRNNLLVDNTIGFQVRFGNPGDEPTFENNDVFGNGTDYDGIADQTGLNGNISADPLFVDQAARDLHLKTGSPAVDAGSAVDAPDTDFDGDHRPVDGDANGVAGFDLGADELTATVGPAVAIDVRPGSTSNRISLREDRTVPVAVLSGPGFAAPSAVDRASLTFGRTGTEASLERCDRRGRDVNADGRADLVCTFHVRATGLRVGDRIAKLTGKLTAGGTFTAKDTVHVVR